jgi:hypothetical protein
MSRRRPSQFSIGSAAASLGPVPGWFHRCRNRAKSMIQSAARSATQSAATRTTGSFGIEALEERTLFTTFPADYAQTGLPGSGTFVYFDGGQNVQISYNDVAFEAVGVQVNGTTGAITVGDLVPGVFAPATEPTQGATLYQIYVVSSAADSYITISNVTQAPDGQLHLHPYSGAVPNFAISNTQGNPAMTAIPAGTGSVLIGALQTVEPPTAPRPVPIASVPLTTPIGIEPAPATGILTPGIEVLPVDPNTSLANNDFGNFLVGGTVTGSVSFPGNVNEFYAGTVLTGDIHGDVLVAASSTRADPGNFSVGGDLREFLTDGPVGNDGVFVTVNGVPFPNYSTSFDLNVGGKLGEFHVGNMEQGPNGSASFAGTIETTNSQYVSTQLPYPTAAITNVTGQLGDQTEWENLEDPTLTQFGEFGLNLNPDDVWADGVVDLRNNVIGDAQLLGSVAVLDPATGAAERDANGNIIYQASVDGALDTINGDGTDYYEIPMLAGTSFQTTLTGAGATVQVIDPDGRSVASNAESPNSAFQVTADRPGLYRFEVTGGVPGAGIAYNLTVTNIGEMGIGGIIVTGNINDMGVDTSIVCSNNDIGAIDVFGTYESLTSGPTPTPPDLQTTATAPVYSPDTIFVSGGNLRALIGGSLGIITKTSTSTVKQGSSTDIEFGYGPYLDVPFGSVGLVRNTSATGVLALQTEFDPNYLDIVSPSGISEPQFVTNDLYATAIGGDIQVIDATNVLYGDLAVDGGIGTIHAASMDTDPASFIDVNADNKGSDGIIDLIDVTGQFGTLESGGPGIVTNEGGQVRYLDLGGTVFRDNFFGGGFDTPVTYSAGQVASLTTDAGNVLTITPIGPISTVTTQSVTTPAANSSSAATTSTSSVSTGPQITVMTYAVRDKGGQVPISITSSGSLSIASNATATGSSEADIATITIQGVGSPIQTNGTDAFGNPEISQTPVVTTTGSSSAVTTSVTNPDGSTTTSTVTTAVGGTTTQLSLVLAGSAKINALNVISTGDATQIINSTTGEIASIIAPNVGQILVHGNLGFTTPEATPAAVLPSAVITDGNTYPFVQQHTGVVISGDAVNIDAYGAIGNVIVTGTLENLVPNFGVTTKVTRNPIAGQFSGIVGPIFVNTAINIDVGQGLLPTGTGLVGFSGIFASGTIGVVNNNNNPNGDIRGNIVSSSTTATNIAIGEISLSSASIIDSKIIDLVGTDFSFTGDLSPVVFGIYTSNANPFVNPYIYGIGSVSVTGDGGIIGSDIEAGDIGPILVNNGGFGIIGTNIVSVLTGRIASVTASGYGIRASNISDGGYIGPVTATGGGGGQISVLNYPIDVRESDAVTIDPYFQFAPTADTDLNAALGTTAAYPNIANVTDTGVIEDCNINAQERLAGVTAQKIRTAEPVVNPNNVLPTPSLPNIPYIGVTFPMSIAVGGTIGYIKVYGLIDGLQVTTGAIGTLALSNNVNRIGISVAGKISNLTVHGNLGQPVLDPETGNYIPDSYVSAGGPSGTIQNLKIYGSLFGNVSATGEIVNMLVAGDVTGSITSLSQSTPYGIGVLHVTGSIQQGSLTIDGNVNTITINGGLGIPNGTLTVDGNANQILIGTDHRQKGSLLRLNLDVAGRLGKLSVYGAITGSVTTGGDLGTLIVQGDGTTQEIVTGNINVGGRLGTARIINGSVSSAITASGSIGNFTISRGNLLGTGVVESLIDTIRSFNITGGSSYNLLGSVIALSGLNGNINVSGNIGDGVNPAVVNFESGNVFHVDGSILTNSTISTTFGLNQLNVDGNVESGVIVSAHPLKKIKVRGSNQGTITTN